MQKESRELATGRLVHEPPKHPGGGVPREIGDLPPRPIAEDAPRLRVSKHPVQLAAEGACVPRTEVERCLAHRLPVRGYVAEHNGRTAGGRLDGWEPEALGERREDDRACAAVEA